jgi:hypothetical protein
VPQKLIERPPHVRHQARWADTICVSRDGYSLLIAEYNGQYETADIMLLCYIASLNYKKKQLMGKSIRMSGGAHNLFQGKNPARKPVDP